MRFKEIIIPYDVAVKIACVHRVARKEVLMGLRLGYPRFFNAANGKTLIIVSYPRYLTIIAVLKKEALFVITAYPSSRWQKNRYRKK
ncbi:MAG: hypothetical protein GXP63_05510 [DPANN group archaeon]|nr:hypothetical protein [DPANN group archaeon]